MWLLASLNWHGILFDHFTMLWQLYMKHDNVLLYDSILELVEIFIVQWCFLYCKLHWLWPWGWNGLAQYQWVMLSRNDEFTHSGMHWFNKWYVWFAIRQPWYSPRHSERFNGHKKMYFMNYMVVVSHDGLLMHIDLGYPRSSHDVILLWDLYRSWQKQFTNNDEYFEDLKIHDIKVKKCSSWDTLAILSFF